MGPFKIPIKRLVINAETQIRILKYDGSATYVDIVSPALATDGFFLEGFLQPVLFGSLKAVVSTTLIKSVAAVAAVAQIATWAMNSVTGDCSSENFWVSYQALKLSGTEYQNQPLLKHYQVSATMASNATGTQVATSIQNAINADPSSPVTVTRSTSTLTFTAKEAGVLFQFYNTPPKRGGLMTGTFTVTTAATNPLNTYDDLKNINWAKNDHLGAFDFDRNAETFPVYNQSYKSYRFILKSTPFITSSLNPAGADPGVSAVTTEFLLYIANGLTLQTTMDLVVADANTAT